MTPDNRNLYSISDLADQVGVPRTTITDWLGKYARFIELRTQGRRRFYTERTLSVLCKIAELRTAGRSSGDIDGELERIFPVHPTVEPPDAPSGAFAPDNAAGAGPAPASPDAANPGQTYPVVKQENFDELYDLLGTRFTDLCDAMSAVNRKADASARRLRLMFAVAVMIIAVLVCFLVIFYAYFRVQRLNTAASRDAASAISALAADSQTRENELRAGLNAVSSKADDIQKLRDDLPAQREAFEAALEEVKKNAASEREAQKALFEAQILREKDQFAAERLKLLADLAEASGKVEELQRKNEALENDLSAAEKRASGEAEARKNAEADADRLRVDLAAVSGKAEALQNLSDNLPAQREAFEAALEEVKKNAGAELEAQKARFETQIAREKEQTAAERDKLRADLVAASGRVEELRKENESLADELSAAEKRASDEAEARKKAEAEAENARRAAAPAQNNNSGRFPYNSYPGME